MSERFIEGMKELQQALERLETNVAKNALTLATRSAARIVQRQAAQNAPIRSEGGLKKTYKGRRVAPGFLARSVNMRTRYNRSRGVARAEIGPSPEAFYGSQFLEVGTSTIAKKPWLVPAFLASRAEVESTFIRDLRAAIDRAVKRGKLR
jgi:HK97 gp10 family phage protein